MYATLPSVRSPAEIRGYISNMLGELADLARLLDDRRLETSMRMLSLEVELNRLRGEGPPGEPGSAH